MQRRCLAEARSAKAGGGGVFMDLTLMSFCGNTVVASLTVM
jgi:hypothetical protein